MGPIISKKYQNIHQDRTNTYVLPRNDNEIDRATNQHYVYREIWSKKDFSAPVEELLQKGVQVLDVGCGPATWILEIGTKYAKSKFMGIDVQPSYPSWIKPRNASFKQVNILKGLPFENDKFDYVQMRFMMLALTLEEWKLIIKEMIRVCKPNGWIELMEEDLIFHNRGPKTELLMKIIAEELNKKGIKTEITSYISELLGANSEITDFSEKENVSRLGSWGGRTGEIHLESLKWRVMNLAGVMQSNQLFRENIMTYDEVIEDFMKECNEGGTFITSKRFYARKNHTNINKCCIFLNPTKWF